MTTSLLLLAAYLIAAYVSLGAYFHYERAAMRQSGDRP